MGKIKCLSLSTTLRDKTSITASYLKRHAINTCLCRKPSYNFAMQEFTYLNGVISLTRDKQAHLVLSDVLHHGRLTARTCSRVCATWRAPRRAPGGTPCCATSCPGALVEYPCASSFASPRAARLWQQPYQQPQPHRKRTDSSKAVICML